MSRIFISYRRADSITMTGRIHDRLVARYGEKNVFKDVDDIPLGVDFRTVLEDEVNACDVQLVIIGPNWLAMADERGERRLDNPDDFVRIELEAGLRRHEFAVIPVLVHNAAMPGSVDLPPSVRNLAYRNAAIVRDDPDFHRDMDRLMKQIELHIATITGEHAPSAKDTLPSPAPESARRALSEPSRPRPVVKAGRRAFPWTALAVVAALVVLAVAAVAVVPQLFNQPSAVAISAENAGTLAELARFPTSDTAQLVRQAAWSSDGKLLAVTDYQTVAVYAARDFKTPLRTMNDHQGAVNAVAFSPDGKWLVSGGSKPDTAVRLWDAESGELKETFEGMDSVRFVGVSHDGEYVMAGDDNYNVVAWSIESGEEVLGIYDAGNLSNAAFSPKDAALALAWSSYSIGVWDLHQSSVDDVESGKIAYLCCHDNELAAIAFSPNGALLASGGYDWQVRVWDVEEGGQVYNFDQHSHHVLAVAFSPDGKLLASGSEDHTVRLWDVEKGEEAGVLSHGDAIYDVAFSPDGKLLAAASADTRVHVWNVEQRKELADIDGHGALVRGVEFSPDGRLLASTSDNDVIVWAVSR